MECVTEKKILATLNNLGRIPTMTVKHILNFTRYPFLVVNPVTISCYVLSTYSICKDKKQENHVSIDKLLQEILLVCSGDVLDFHIYCAIYILKPELYKAALKNELYLVKTNHQILPILSKNLRTTRVRGYFSKIQKKMGFELGLNYVEC